MNAWLLIALSLLSTTARASVSNVLAKRFVQAGEDARLFNTIAGLAASALLFIVSASREPDGTGMLPLALVFGLVYFAAFTSYSKAMSLGPMSYTSLATSLGMVLPGETRIDVIGGDDDAKAGESEVPTTASEAEKAESAIIEDAPWYIKVLDTVFFFGGTEGETVSSTGGQ